VSLPSPPEIERIGAIGSPVIRNLEITYAYSQLAAAVARRCGQGANWCAFATWASRQAGRTIRGEDMIEYVQQRLGRDADLLHPLQSLGRVLLRAGLFNPGSPLGRLLGRLHTPFDAFELASDAVARGNRKVFVEIGAEFARYLAAPDFDAFLDGLKPGEPPDGQRLLRQAFVHYEQLRTETDPRTRAQLGLLANLEIGMHEQTRLQPEIGEAMDAPIVTEEELGARLFPCLKRPRSRRLAGKLAQPAQGPLAELAREAITHSFMVLSVPGRVLALGADLAAPVPELLRVLSNAELEALLALYEPVAPAVDHSGARDWSDLHQRMHYIVHLFRAFHATEDLFLAPFTPEQVERFMAGVVPDGEL
jgi:hypothetical protein